MADPNTARLITALSEIIAGSRHMTAELAHDLRTELHETEILRDQVRKLQGGE